MGRQFKGYIGVYEFARQTGQKAKDVYAQIRTGKLSAKRMGVKRIWQIAKKVAGFSHPAVVPELQ